MSELPTSWTRAKIGDVVAFGRSKKAEPEDIPSDAWMLELEDVERDTSTLLIRVSAGQRNSKSTKNVFKRGDVLYGKLRPYLNKVLLATEDGFCSTEIVPLHAEGAVDQRYLFHWLKSPEFLAYVTAASHGMNMPRLGTEAGNAAPFVIAPLCEQARIADKLDKLLARVDACRDRLDRLTVLLKSFRRAVLHAATTGGLTEDWRTANGGSNSRIVRLREVAGGFGYGTAAKSSPSGTTPVLRMGNIQNGTLDWTDLVFTSDTDEITKYALSDGDVLFNRTNSPELVGKTAVFRGERLAVFAGYLVRARCGSELLPDFLNHCLGSPAGRDYCRRVKSDGVSQSNINAQKLANFEFLLPSIPEQREILRRVANLHRAADALDCHLRAALRAAVATERSCLAKAFRGDLVPQDPADEPAELMLERLRATEAPEASARRRRRPATA